MQIVLLTPIITFFLIAGILYIAEKMKKDKK